MLGLRQEMFLVMGMCLECERIASSIHAMLIKCLGWMALCQIHRELGPRID